MSPAWSSRTRNGRATFIGSTLTGSDHQLLALWVTSCAEHVLDRFESARPQDPRPRQTIGQARAWVGRRLLDPRRLGQGHPVATPLMLAGR